MAGRVLKFLLAAGVLLSCLGAGMALAQTATTPGAAGLIAKLRQGGYNLYVRHAATDWSQSDRISSYGEWASCDPGEVRQLSDAGRRSARAVGTALSALGVRFGRVLASPYCRAIETARLMSGQDVEPTLDLMNLRSASYVGGREAVVERARQRLSRPPRTGTNALLAAHGNLGRAATGQSLGEGEILVVSPRGDGQFDIAGTLSPADLAGLVAK